MKRCIARTTFTMPFSAAHAKTLYGELTRLWAICRTHQYRER